MIYLIKKIPSSDLLHFNHPYTDAVAYWIKTVTKIRNKFGLTEHGLPKPATFSIVLNKIYTL